MEALDLWSDEAASSAKFQPGEGTALPATAGESFDAAWNAGKVLNNFQATQRTRGQVLDDYEKKIEALGGDVQSAYNQAWTKAPMGSFGYPVPPDRLTVANEVLAGLKEKNPAVDMQPMSDDELHHRMAGIAGAAGQEHAEVASREMTFGAKAADIAGSLGSAIFTDPINLLALLLAPELDAATVAGAAVKGAATFGPFGAAQQGLTEAANQRLIQDVEPGHSPGQAILEAGVGGAALGAGGALVGKGLQALGRWWTRTKTPDMPTSLKDAGNVVESEANIQSSNVLPGAEGEAAHRRALSDAIDSIIAERPVEPHLEQYSNEIGAASERQQVGFETRQAAEAAEELQQIDREISQAPSYEDRRLLTQQREEIEARSPKPAFVSQPQTMIGFLKQMGGLRDDPQLAGRDLRTSYPGLMNNKRGVSLDAAREAAAEAGYFGYPIDRAMSETTISDFLDKLEAHPHYSDRDAEQLARFHAQREAAVDRRMFERHLSDVQTFAKKNGLDVRDKELMGEAARVLAEGREKEIDNAIERAAIDLYKRDADLAAANNEGRLHNGIEAAGLDEEARRFSNNIGERGGGPGQKGASTGAREEVFRPSQAVQQTGELLQKVAASPDYYKALQADAERAVDEAAKSGQKLEIPTGVDGDGNIIMQSVSSLLSEIEADKKAAEELMNCATPMSEMKEAAE